MMKNTFKDYKSAIKGHYENVKNLEVSGILAHPSPAQMRTLCLLILEKGISRKEEEICRLFFETKENQSLKKSIENCNVDKFKSVISFLKTESDSENPIRIEISALLVDFKNRPYSVFSNAEDLQLINKEKNELTATLFDEIEVKKKSVNFIKSEEIIPKNFSISKKRIVIGLFAIVSTLSIGYTSKNMIFPEKECMQWKINQYEMVDCLSENINLVDAIAIKPFDKKIFELKKIKVCDTTTFFKGKKALIWYCKVNGKPEYFSSHGLHPVTEQALKPITSHIINKYVEPCK